MSKKIILILLLIFNILVITGCTPKDSGEATPPTAAEFIIQTVWFILAGFFVYWLMVIQPKKVEAQEHKKLVEGLKKNDQVLVNGIFARVVSIKDDAITVEIANDVKIRVKPEVVALIAENTEKKEVSSSKK